MPSDTLIELRDRTLVAFTLVSGMRDKAITTLRLKHIDVDRRLIHQDPREVDTKFSKQIVTAFFPVGDDLIQIVIDWVNFLRSDLLYGLDDPLFPQTRVVNDTEAGFRVDGLKPTPWSNATAIRDIFHKAFDRAGLPYSNPHLFRKTLAELGQRICQTPEQLKAWSQNLGHENVLTTFTSYGQISIDRQAKLIRDLGQPQDEGSAITRADLEEMIRRVVR